MIDSLPLPTSLEFSLLLAFSTSRLISLCSRFIFERERERERKRERGERFSLEASFG